MKKTWSTNMIDLDEIANCNSADKLKKCIYRFADLHLVNIFKNNEYDYIITDVLVNKYIITLIEYLVESLNSLSKYNHKIINPKEILSAYLITHFQNDTLSSTLSDKEQLIYDKSCELVKYLDKLTVESDETELLLIKKKLTTYKFIFNNWKKEDLQSQIEIYCNLYQDYRSKIEILKKDIDDDIAEITNFNEIELNIKEIQNGVGENIEIKKSLEEIIESKKGYMKYLEDTQDKIKYAVENVVGDGEFQNTIKKHKYVEQKFDNSINRLIKNYLKKAFWADFKAGLMKDPSDYNYFNGIIKDLNNYFSILFSKRPEKIELLRELFNPEYFAELINNNSISDNEISKLCKTLLDETQNLDSYSNKTFNAYKDKLDFVENREEFINLVVEIISYCIEKLEWLSDVIIKIRDYSNNKHSKN